jgi:hypothetical protein
MESRDLTEQEIAQAAGIIAERNAEEVNARIYAEDIVQGAIRYKPKTAARKIEESKDSDAWMPKPQANLSSHRLLDRAIEFKYRNKHYEKRILETTNSYYCLEYIDKKIKGRWPEYEEKLKKELEEGTAGFELRESLISKCMHYLEIARVDTFPEFENFVDNAIECLITQETTANVNEEALVEYRVNKRSWERIFNALGNSEKQITQHRLRLLENIYLAEKLSKLYFRFCFNKFIVEKNPTKTEYYSDRLIAKAKQAVKTILLKKVEVVVGLADTIIQNMKNNDRRKVFLLSVVLRKVFSEKSSVLPVDSFIKIFREEDKDITKAFLQCAYLVCQHVLNKEQTPYNELTAEGSRVRDEFEVADWLTDFNTYLKEYGLQENIQQIFDMCVGQYKKQPLLIFKIAQGFEIKLTEAIEQEAAIALYKFMFEAKKYDCNSMIRSRLGHSWYMGHREAGTNVMHANYDKMYGYSCLFDSWLIYMKKVKKDRITMLEKMIVDLPNATMAKEYAKTLTEVKKKNLIPKEVKE